MSPRRYRHHPPHKHRGRYISLVNKIKLFTEFADIIRTHGNFSLKFSGKYSELKTVILKLVYGRYQIVLEELQS